MADAVAYTGNSVGRGGNRGGSERLWRGQAREKPTHFISVPLDHLQGFTSQISRFTDALQAVSPPIDGLDSSIVISPRRLHLTLGVMSLGSEDNQTIQTQVDPSQARGKDGARVMPRKSIAAALALLHTLKPDIEFALQSQPLYLCLNEFAVMRRSPAGESDVMYIGPAATGTKSEQHTRSVGILETVNRRFIEEGFITDKRPLKLHCTILNTTYRKSGNKRTRQRIPFSMTQIEDSITQRPHTTGTLLSSDSLLAVRELNICRMGSYDEVGRYVRVGGIEW